MIDAELAALVALRRDLHAHPELGYEEHRTAGIVAAGLRQAGLEVVEGLAGGTGVMAHLPGAGDAAIGLRADMDALPIEERSGLPHASVSPGRMHACGHDGHTAILLGAARVLSRIAAEGGLPRPVSFLFQPAEEGGGGGRRMVEDGCCDGTRLGPPLHRLFGLHGWPRLPLGTLATRPGPLLASADTFRAVIRGVGSHAAFPHTGRDPIIAACAAVSALQTVAARNVDPLESVVISVTMVRAGTATNIIPDEAEFAGTVRALSAATRHLAQRRVQEVIEGVAAALGCGAVVQHETGYPVTVNHPEAVADFEAAARGAFGAPRVLRVERPVMGAEDFAFYGQVVPSCFFFLGLVAEGATQPAQLHQATFDFNDDALAIGIEAFCRLALGDAAS
jgi:amidohydrolase